MEKPLYKYQFQNNTYFKEFFDHTTDIYFFRIVDQMAWMNQQ